MQNLENAQKYTVVGYFETSDAFPGSKYAKNMFSGRALQHQH